MYIQNNNQIDATNGQRSSGSIVWRRRAERAAVGRARRVSASERDSAFPRRQMQNARDHERERAWHRRRGRQLGDQLRFAQKPRGRLARLRDLLASHRTHGSFRQTRRGHQFRGSALARHFGAHSETFRTTYRQAGRVRSRTNRENKQIVAPPSIRSIVIIDNIFFFYVLFYFIYLFLFHFFSLL